MLQGLAGSWRSKPKSDMLSGTVDPTYQHPKGGFTLTQRTRFARPLAVLAIVLVLAAAALAVAPALANHSNFYYVAGPDLANLSCTPGAPAYALWNLSFSGITSHTIDYTLTNLNKNTSTSWLVSGGAMGDIDLTNFSNWLPGGGV